MYFTLHIQAERSQNNFRMTTCLLNKTVYTCHVDNALFIRNDLYRDQIYEAKMKKQKRGKKI